MANNNEKMVANSPSRIWRQPIFDMQDFESAPAFAAFQQYRDGGHDRTLQQVAVEGERNLNLIKRWSAAHCWVRRADDYDDFLDKQRIKAASKKARQMGERHAQLAVLAFSNVVEFVASGRLKSELNGNNFARIFETVVKVERQARGESGEIVEIKRSPYAKRVSMARMVLAELAEEFPNLSAREMLRITSEDWRIEELDLEDVLSARLLSEEAKEDEFNEGGE